MTVYTVVVTYNRLNLLKEGIEAIKCQTSTIDKIVVVNNGSTDGTKQWLSEQEGLVVINQDNVGGAGGFHTGVKYAYEDGAEWIWMMDDDVAPEPECLAELLMHREFSKCMHPLKKFQDNKLYVWGEYLEIEKNYMFHLTQCQCENKNIFYVNCGCFEGMLIHSEIVAKIGYPDSRFFIAGDDTIYGYLANQFTNVCVVNSAKMIRARSSKIDNFKPMYIYYELRNFHLFEEYSIKYTGLVYNLSTNCKLFGKAGRYLIRALFFKGDFNIKTKLIKAIFRGVLHAKSKKINKSY